MALKIRLTRGGAKKNPHYSIIVAENWRRRDGKFIEKLGHYHPCSNKDIKDKVVLNSERATYWLSVGALPTDVVVKLMVNSGFEQAKKFQKKIVKTVHHGLSKKEVEALKKQEAENEKIRIQNAADKAKKLAIEQAEAEKMQKAEQTAKEQAEAIAAEEGTGETSNTET